MSYLDWWLIGSCACMWLLAPRYRRASPLQDRFPFMAWLAFGLVSFTWPLTLPVVVISALVRGEARPE